MDRGRHRALTALAHFAALVGIGVLAGVACALCGWFLASYLTVWLFWATFTLITS